MVSVSEIAAVGDSSETVSGDAAAGSSNRLGGSSVIQGSDVVLFSAVADICATGA